MENDLKILKTKSQKIISTVQNELKKYSPMGASKRQFYIDPKLPKGQSEKLAKKIYTFTEKNKYINAPLMNYLESNYRVKDIHARLPRPPSSDVRRTVASPQGFHTPMARSPDRSPELIRKNSLRRMMSEVEPQEVERAHSPNLDAVNEIIEACDNASNPKEKIIPHVLNNYSRQMERLATQVERVIHRQRGDSHEEGKLIEKELAKDFYDVQGKREMIETDMVDRMIKKETFRIRQYSLPKHLDNFLRQHTNL